jgi:predicted transcriptional regulator
MSDVVVGEALVSSSRSGEGSREGLGMGCRLCRQQCFLMAAAERSEALA